MTEKDRDYTNVSPEVVQRICQNLWNDVHPNCELALRHVGEAALITMAIEAGSTTVHEGLEVLRESLGKAWEPLYCAHLNSSPGGEYTGEKALDEKPEPGPIAPILAKKQIDEAVRVTGNVFVILAKIRKLSELRDNPEARERMATAVGVEAASVTLDGYSNDINKAIDGQLDKLYIAVESVQLSISDMHAALKDYVDGEDAEDDEEDGEDEDAGKAA